MKKIRGGKNRKLWSIFFIFTFLFFLSKNYIVHAENNLLINDGYFQDELNDEAIQLNLLEMKKIIPCTPPPEGQYDRSWSLNTWMAQNSNLETELRSVTTTQKGNTDPAPFVGTNWKKEIRQFKKAWDLFVGPIPHVNCVPLDPQDEPLGLTPAEEARINTSSYSMKKVSYQGDHGERIPAFLLTPKNLVPNQKVPAVLVMHQSLPICGKKEAVGVCLQGTPWLDFAKDLAERGFVTLAPDSIGYGDRSEYYNNYGMEYPDAAPLLSRFPSSTLMGLRIADVKRGIDYLKTIHEVDDKRIGMIGHSNGGIETLFNAANDKRIKCAVTNAGPNLIRREVLGWWGLNPGVARWAGSAYLPGMGFFNNDVKNLPIEFHQLYAMVAPRGLFLSLIEDDQVAPNYDYIQFSIDETKKAYNALGGDFAYHIVKTGLTPENIREWGAPMCMYENYNTCVKNKDQQCLDRFDAVGVNPICIQQNGSLDSCTHKLWMNCLNQGQSEDVCKNTFSSVGVTNTCIDEASKKHLRRDHGWYPETEAAAYPWLEQCLRR